MVDVDVKRMMKSNIKDFYTNCNDECVKSVSKLKPVKILKNKYSWSIKSRTRYSKMITDKYRELIQTYANELDRLDRRNLQEAIAACYCFILPKKKYSQLKSKVMSDSKNYYAKKGEVGKKADIDGIYYMSYDEVCIISSEDCPLDIGTYVEDTNDLYLMCIKSDLLFKYLKYKKEK